MKSNLALKNITSIIVAVLLALVIYHEVIETRQPRISPHETAYERVMRTNVLRCGYSVWDPGIYKDAATGQVSGVMVPLMQAIGDTLGLKIEWTEEVDWGQIQTALENQRIDIHCAGMWRDPARAGRMIYSQPLFHSEVGVVVRADDARFPLTKTYGPEDFNRAEFATTIIDGGILDKVTHDLFPAVRLSHISELSNDGDELAALLAKKVDFIVIAKTAAVGFIKNSPGQIGVLKFNGLRNYDNVLALPLGDYNLWQFINVGIQEILSGPEYKTIMQPYVDKYQGALTEATR